LGPLPYKQMDLLRIVRLDLVHKWEDQQHQQRHWPAGKPRVQIQQQDKNISFIFRVSVDLGFNPINRPVEP
jgi:hypothetical protein